MYKIAKVAKKVVLSGLGLVMGVMLSLGMSVTVNAEEETPRYEIRVNRAANCVTVYEKDETGSYAIPIKAMACSCGLEEGSTPLGTFSTSDYYDWRLMVDNTYGQYAVRFVNRILFHSVPYVKDSADTLLTEEYNKLGEDASHGCVRLSVKDSKWIYDNCEKGTTVIVYDDAMNPGPLGNEDYGSTSIWQLGSDRCYKGRESMEKRNTFLIFNKRHGRRCNLCSGRCYTG